MLLLSLTCSFKCLILTRMVSFNSLKWPSKQVGSDRGCIHNSRLSLSSLQTASCPRKLFEPSNIQGKNLLKWKKMASKNCFYNGKENALKTGFRFTLTPLGAFSLKYTLMVYFYNYSELSGWRCGKSGGIWKARKLLKNIVKKTVHRVLYNKQKCFFPLLKKYIKSKEIL